MKIGCMDKLKCEHIDRKYCCVDCTDFIKCEEPCMYLLDGEINRDKIIKLCKFVKAK